jgi:HEAT repeat protein
MRRRLAILVILASVSPLTAAETSTGVLEQALPAIRAERQDLKIRVDRWDTRFPLRAVDELLADPLAVSPRFSEWTSTLVKTNASSAWVRQSAALLDQHMTLSSTSSISAISLPGASALPAPVVRAVEQIAGAIAAAQPLLEQSVNSISFEERRQVEAAWRDMIHNGDETDTSLRTAAQTLERLKLAPLLQAAYQITAAIDGVLPDLQANANAIPARWQRRWPFKFGDVVVAGPGKQKWKAKDLQNTALLITFGGIHYYKGNVAGSHDKQIRVVIDLGDEVSVDAREESASAGAGVFGIGLLYLPNPALKLQLNTGDVSQGAGFFGVGGLFMNSPAVRSEGYNFAQGAGLFGIGMFSNRVGDGSRYSTRFLGQGVGLTRGIGIFLHEGQSAELQAGLYYPDPRDPLALTSVCQGAGYGPRAFAAGGIGLAIIQGDHNHLMSGYMAQGMGYWRSLGGLSVSGQENRIQSRRYVLGSGVHTGIGVFHLKGSKNNVANWAVGPAYGWDYGVGVAVAEGDENTFQGEWGLCHAEMNGVSLALFQGNANQLALAHCGSGATSRNAPSYAVAVAQGENNSLKFPELSAPISAAVDLPGALWGVFRGTGTFTLNPKVDLPKPEWPAPSRTGPARDDEKRMRERLKLTEGMPLPEQIAAWVSIAAHFGLDDQTPRQARQKLLALSDSELPLLVSRISPDSADEYFQLRLTGAAYGPRLVPALRSEISRADSMRRAMLAGFLASARVDQAFEPLTRATKDPDWRVRRVATLALGSFSDRQTGTTPGRLALLNLAHELARSTAPLTDQEIQDRFHQVYLPSVMSILSLNSALPFSDRAAFMDKQANIFESVSPAVLREFIQLLTRDAATFDALLSAEIADIDRRTPEIRQILIAQLQDPEPEVVQAAVLGLGGMANAADIPRLEDLFKAPAALIREAAATGLGLMGDVAKPALKKALASPDPRARVLASVAIAQTSSADVAALLIPELQSSDSTLQMTSIAGICQPYFPAKPNSAKFRAILQELAEKSPFPAVRAAASNSLTCVSL